MANDTAQLKELISTARYARCRSRFVMPVILFENKVCSLFHDYICTHRNTFVFCELQNVCRSATLSTMAEMYGRAGMDWFTGMIV